MAGIVNRINKTVAVKASELEKPRDEGYRWFYPRDCARVPALFRMLSMMHKMCMSYFGIFTLTYIILKGKEEGSWYTDDGLIMQVNSMSNANCVSCVATGHCDDDY